MLPLVHKEHFATCVILTGLNVIWSRCFMSYFVFYFSYLYVSNSGSITTVGEENANMSAIVYL